MELDAAAWAERLEIFRRGVDLRLDAEGRWLHEGEPFEHPRLIAFFDQGIDLHPETGEPILRVGDKWCYISAEDVPFLVRKLRETPEGLEATLNTGERVLVPEAGFESTGERVYLQLGRRRARLDRLTQASLVAWLEEGSAGLEVHATGRSYPIKEEGP